MIFLLSGDPSCVDLAEACCETTVSDRLFHEDGRGFGIPGYMIAVPQGSGKGDYQRFMIPLGRNYSGMDDRCGESEVVSECGSRELYEYGEFVMYLPEGSG